MGWEQSRISSLENRLMEIVELLGGIKENLTYENDPQERGKLNSKIIGLKKQKDDYSQELKSYGEGQKIARTMANVDFMDLEFVIAALLRQQTSDSGHHSTYLPTKPEQKMSKNGLTPEIRMLLDPGLMKANEVRNLLENFAKIDYCPDIAIKLKSTLNSEYSRLTDEGIRGDDLFEKLHKFSSCNNPDFKRQMAGLAVLCYFFETCDIFEP